MNNGHNKVRHIDLSQHRVKLASFRATARRNHRQVIVEHKLWQQIKLKYAPFGSQSQTSTAASIKIECGEVGRKRITRERQRTSNNSSGIKGCRHGCIHGCFVIGDVVGSRIRLSVDKIWRRQQVVRCRRHHWPCGGRGLQTIQRIQIIPAVNNVKCRQLGALQYYMAYDRSSIQINSFILASRLLTRCYKAGPMPSIDYLYRDPNNRNTRVSNPLLTAMQQ